MSLSLKQESGPHIHIPACITGSKRSFFHLSRLLLFIISIVEKKCLFTEAEDQVSNFSPIQMIHLMLVCFLGPGGYLRS